MKNDPDLPQLEISWATCPKWATRPGADCLELVETPTGQFAVILVDVQGSGSAGARKLGLALVSFCRGLLASGVSAEIAARSTAQYLAGARDGKVGASIHCLLISREQSSLAISGYGPLAIATLGEGQEPSFQSLDGQIAGFSSDAGPESVLTEIPAPGRVVVANDGVAANSAAFSGLAGNRDARSADDYLTLSNDADNGRPRSDKSIVVLSRFYATLADRRLSGALVLPHANGFAHV
jgi:hypothetical protein